MPGEIGVVVSGIDPALLTHEELVELSKLRAKKLKETRDRVRHTKDALNLFAQRAFAKVAAEYLRAGAKMADHPVPRSLIEDELLQPHLFTQKSPQHMRFY